ncbi:hypothetical protein F5Y09DRAFT_347372 [Xylaria sp. FL1042]|nr:hypothetical protein F5Y09DRAFT_347372 [Xylaria sp. FL1042]
MTVMIVRSKRKRRAKKVTQEHLSYDERQYEVYTGPRVELSGPDLTGVFPRYELPIPPPTGIIPRQELPAEQQHLMVHREGLQGIMGGGYPEGSRELRALGQHGEDEGPFCEPGDYGKGLDAIDGIRKACTELMGTYNIGESRQFCIQEPNGTKWNFDLKNIGWTVFQIGLEQCSNGMSKEVHGCPRGGHRGYWRWRYKADPNLGHCVEPLLPPPDQILQQPDAEEKKERRFIA